MKPMRISVWDPPGTKGQPQSALLKLDDENPPIAALAIEQGFVLVFDLPDTAVYSHGAYLSTVLPDRTDGQRVILGAHIDVDMLPADPEPAPLPDLPRLIAVGQALRQADGTRWTAIEATDFHLLGRELAGEDTTPVLEQRAACGYNLLRLFTAYDIPNTIGVLKPKDHPKFYEDVQAAVKRYMGFGFYVELVGFTGLYPTVLANDAAKIDHWEALIDVAVESSNVLLELVNEYSVTANHDIPFSQLRKPPAQVMASHGSNGSALWPVTPYWTYASFHTNEEAFEHQRKVGHNAWEIWKGPTLTNETRRYTDKISRVEIAFDAAAGAALLCAGSCFHSIHGKNSTLWTGKELDAAIQWAAGARSVPLSAQGQPYHHRKDLETPGILRAYQRGNSPAHVVRIRK